MSSERAAVAREVLTEFTEYFSENFASTVTHRDLVAKFTAERYPSPPAPETVTVAHNGRDVEWWRDGKNWRSNDDWWFPVATREGDFICRIASDARVLGEKEARIAELEDAAKERESLIARLDANCVTLQSERDAALRALEERSALGNETPTQFIPVNGAAVIGATSCNVAGCRCGEVGGPAAACDVSSITQSGAASSDESSAASPSPAPIPLGATRRWWLVIDSDGNVSVANSLTTAREWAETWAAADKMAYSVVPVIEAVAARETVERVKLEVMNAYLNSGNWDVTARAALSAAGFTLEGA